MRTTKKDHWIVAGLVFSMAVAGTTCKQPPAELLPQLMAPPLHLQGKNLILGQDDLTAVPFGSGRLEVWSARDGRYEKIWAARTFSCCGVAVGDVDGDGRKEIVGLSNWWVRRGKGKAREEYIRYFLCSYKEEFSHDSLGLWRTTFFDGLDNNIRASDGPSATEVLIADIDGDRIGEIVVLAGGWLAVYKYNPGIASLPAGVPGAFQKICALEPRISNQYVRLRSLAVADIDGEAGDEILIASNWERRERLPLGSLRRSLESQGFLLIYKFENGSVSLLKSLSLDAFLTFESLRIGDLNGDQSPEICSTVYRAENEECQAFLFIWDRNPDWKRWEIPIGSPEKCGFEGGYEVNVPNNHLAVGEFDDRHRGAEIVFALGNFRLIRKGFWDGGTNFVLMKEIALFDHHWVEIANLYAADIDHDQLDEVIAMGMGKSGPDSGNFYLEVFDQNLVTEWVRLGGERKESRVTCLAID